MQVRVFESTDMASGLKLVRKELGADALILSTRTIRNGKLGILGKPILEITAAIDTPWPREKKAEQAVENQQNPIRSKLISTGRTINCTVGGTDDLLPTYGTPTSPSPTANPARPGSLAMADEKTSENDLRQEFDELKNLVKNLASNINRISQPRDENPACAVPGLEPQPTLQSRLQAMRPPADQLIEYLLAYGIDLDTAKTMTDFARESLGEC